MNVYPKTELSCLIKYDCIFAVDDKEYHDIYYGIDAFLYLNKPWYTNKPQIKAIEDTDQDPTVYPYIRIEYEYDYDENETLWLILDHSGTDDQIE